MLAKLKFTTLALLCSLSLSGCCCCAPSELFSCIDRHCFYADWTSHYNCVNRCCYSGQCQQPVPAPHGDILVLGSAAPADDSVD